MELEQLYQQSKVASLFGKYITLESIEPILHSFSAAGQLEVIGQSVLGKPIYKYQIGSGATRILLWSQMHGNESTTTKALMDWITFLNSTTPESKLMLSAFTFVFLPMLNPDGAQMYTRENANQVDLNRDALAQTQPESQLLLQVYQQFQPDYCYNMHDQRTIFGTSDLLLPATVSFLAPAYDAATSINASRKKAMDVIVAMNTCLQQYLPNQVGRFDDTFNANCVGDRFQQLGTPTILIEAGFYPNDYNREETRRFVFFALFSGFHYLSENDIVANEIVDYLNIPQNKVCFYDIVYKNIKINYDNNEIITNFAVQYKEEILNNSLFFNAYIVEIGDLTGFFGHYEFDAKMLLYRDELGAIPERNRAANFYLGTELEVVNGLFV